MTDSISGHLVAVRKPQWHWLCWAVLRTGKNCGNERANGWLTCHLHQDREMAAQRERVDEHV